MNDPSKPPDSPGLAALKKTCQSYKTVAAEIAGIQGDLSPEHDALMESARNEILKTIVVLEEIIKRNGE